MFAHNGEKLTGGILLIRLTTCILTLLLPGIGYAAETAENAPQNNILGLMMPIGVFILIFYFLMYRPQKKKQQQHDQMLSSVTRGDMVVTAGGFFGRVLDVLDDSYIIEISDGVNARILKSSISSKRESGDDKNRPRKLKKKKRAHRDEIAETAGIPANEASSSKSAEEGVTAEEHKALFDAKE
jgi:preprotein translocase subunit YajC